MSTLKFKHWLNTVDPYAIQQMIFYKALFIATVMVYLYWFALPVNFIAYVVPFFVLFLYEMPVLSSFKKKNQLLIFISASMLFVSISFYLVYPFRGVFFFFSLLVMIVLYFAVLKYFYALKSLTLLVISMATIILDVQPPANLQVAYGFISSMLLSLIVTVVCLKLFFNNYLTIWNKALQQFIKYFEEDIEVALQQGSTQRFIKAEIVHFEMVRNFQRLVGKQYILPTYRIASYIRNIQLSFDNIYFEEKNELFWQEIRQNLRDLRLKMDSYSICTLSNLSTPPLTKLQHYTWDCLNRAVAHWNRLCVLKNS